MKQRIQEIGIGGGGGSAFDEPAPDPRKGKWSGRMGWKPSGNPRLHPDEEAALAAGQPDTGPELPPESSEPFEQPMGGPAAPRQTSRMNWTPSGVPSAKSGAGSPNLGREMTGQDIDTIIQAIRAEQALPPHKQNSAKISQLKAQAMNMMSQAESQWVQRQANRLLPSIEG